MAPRGKCYNRGMQAHLNLKHKEIYNTVQEKRTEMQVEKSNRETKDETVRGSVPIFSLRNKEEKEAFLKLVGSIRLLIC